MSLAHLLNDDDPPSSSSSAPSLPAANSTKKGKGRASVSKADAFDDGDDDFGSTSAKKVGRGFSKMIIVDWS